MTSRRAAAVAISLLGALAHDAGAAARAAVPGPAGGAAAAIDAGSSPLALVVVNARLVDGTGAPVRKGNLRVVGDRIAAVGEVTPAPGDEVLARVAPHPYPLALGGHMHTRETLRYEAGAVVTRFEQAAAIVGPNEAGPLKMTSGVTLYRVEDGRIDAGTFLPLDPPSP